MVLSGGTALLFILFCALALSACSSTDPKTGPDHDRSIAAARGTVLGPGLPAYVDLDGDGVLERVLLDNKGRLTITDGSTIYQTRDKWRLVAACLGDTDGDGLTEIVGLVDSEKGRHLALWGAASIGSGHEYRERLVTSPVVPRPRALSITVREEADDPTLPGRGDLVVLTAVAPDLDGGPQQTAYRWNGFSFTIVGPIE